MIAFMFAVLTGKRGFERQAVGHANAWRAEVHGEARWLRVFPGERH